LKSKKREQQRSRPADAVADDNPSPPPKRPDQASLQKQNSRHAKLSLSTTTVEGATEPPEAEGGDCLRCLRCRRRSHASASLASAAPAAPATNASRLARAACLSASKARK